MNRPLKQHQHARTGPQKHSFQDRAVIEELSVSKRTVLIAEDDPGILELLSQKLRLEGFDCHSCSSGRETLQLMGKGTFDVIISDLQMPGIGGLKLVEQVHKKYQQEISAFYVPDGHRRG